MMIVYPVFVEKGAHFSTNMVILAKKHGCTNHFQKEQWMVYGLRMFSTYSTIFLTTEKPI